MELNKKKKILLKISTAVILVVSSIYLFAPWKFVLYYLTPIPETVQELVEEAARQDIDGIIVYIHKNGHQPELYASGWHDRQQKVPANPQALFKIGSIRKLYDAVALTKLVESSQLSLDKTLVEYLPNLRGRIENAEKITLRMMVQHRSGIPNYTDHKDFDWASSELNEIELVLDTPATFEPGSKYDYSNTNYLLLRRIMHDSLGYPHDQFIKETILTPLDLKRTFFSIEDINQAELMSGYYVGYDTDFKELDQGMIASAMDVANFVRALNEGSFFSEKEQAVYNSLYEYGHSGWVLGYSSRAYFHEDIDTVVVQFVNTTGNDTVMLTQIIYDRILKILRR